MLAVGGGRAHLFGETARRGRTGTAGRRRNILRLQDQGDHFFLEPVFFHLGALGLGRQEKQSREHDDDTEGEPYPLIPVKGVELLEEYATRKDREEDKVALQQRNDEERVEELEAVVEPPQPDHHGEDPDGRGRIREPTRKHEVLLVVSVVLKEQRKHLGLDDGLRAEQRARHRINARKYELHQDELLVLQLPVGALQPLEKMVGDLEDDDENEHKDEVPDVHWGCKRGGGEECD